MVRDSARRRYAERDAVFDRRCHARHRGVVSVNVARETVDTDALSAIKDGAQTCDGAMWVLFGLGDGLQQLNVAATAGANPGTANSYRIWLDIEPNG